MTIAKLTIKGKIKAMQDAIDCDIKYSSSQVFDFRKNTCCVTYIFERGGSVLDEVMELVDVGSMDMRGVDVISLVESIDE